MVKCDACDEDVLEVWRHREVSESMTHRRVVWVCRECHPEVHQRVDVIEPEKGAVAD